MAIIGLTERISLADLQIGDTISCEYTATSSAVGSFTNIGNASKTEISTLGAATPNGSFNFICVDRKAGVGGICVADRVVQNSVNWDVLNAGKMMEGKIENMNFTLLNSDPLNYDVTKTVQTPISIEFNNELYIMWQEQDINLIYQIRVKKWNGTAWVTADNNIGLNYDVTKNSHMPKPIIFNNELYITWFEHNSAGTAYQIRVKKWNGSAWVTADINTGLNYDVTKQAQHSQLIVFNNELYITWEEINSSGVYQIRVKKWNGSAWVTADGNTPLNYDATKNAFYARLIVFGGVLYITWYEINSTYQIRVKKWNGSAWVTADINTPLNYTPTQHGTNPVPLLFNSELYIFWQESGTSWKIRGKKWNGTAWVTADNNIGLNYDITMGVEFVNLVIFKNELYAIWSEYNTSTAYQIRVKKWNGTTWVTADNNISLNYDITMGASRPQSIVFNNELYIMWYENNGIIDQIRYKKFEFTTGLIRSLSGGVGYADASGNLSITNQSLNAFPTNNTWDKYITTNTLNSKIIANDPNVWNHGTIESWVQETPTTGIAINTSRVKRKQSTFATIVSTTANATTGFRPVLIWRDDLGSVI